MCRYASPADAVFCAVHSAAGRALCEGADREDQRRCKKTVRFFIAVPSSIFERTIP